MSAPLDVRPSALMSASLEAKMQGRRPLLKSRRDAHRSPKGCSSSSACQGVAKGEDWKGRSSKPEGLIYKTEV